MVERPTGTFERELMSKWKSEVEVKGNQNLQEHNCSIQPVCIHSFTMICHTLASCQYTKGIQQQSPFTFYICHYSSPLDIYFDYIFCSFSYIIHLCSCFLSSSATIGCALWFLTTAENIQTAPHLAILTSSCFWSSYSSLYGFGCMTVHLCVWVKGGQQQRNNVMPIQSRLNKFCSRILNCWSYINTN